MLEFNNQKWTNLEKIAFRFVFSYFILYIFPFPIDLLDFNGTLGTWITSGWEYLATWIASLIKIEGEVSSQMTGSGDKLFNFLVNGITLGLSIISAIIWSMVDKGRQNYARLQEILLILVRYYLAYTMSSYGFAKVFKSQFPFPSLYRLTQAYGDSSPMGLAWTFMGYSTLYCKFAGYMELIGGVLLLFRKTATIGALLLVGVMGNVFMMNMSFDIPVKLFSFNLMFMAGFIAWVRDGQRLLQVLFLNQATKAKKEIKRIGDLFHLNQPWLYPAQLVVKGLLIVYILGYQTYLWNQRMAQWGDDVPKPPLYGIYDVEHFVLNQDTIPPLLTDTTRWRRLIVNYPTSLRVYEMDNQTKNFQFEPDTTAQTFHMHLFSDSTFVFDGQYSRPDSGVLEFSGMLNGDSLHLHMKQYDVQKFRLVNRGFHWINPVPFNR